MAFDRTFNVAERREVDRAFEVAEARAAEFYRIPGREWSLFLHDLQTLREGPGPHPGAFADVVKLESTGTDTRPREIYRIRVRDDAILSALSSRRDGIQFFPLMLYVLTHEMVHVVRFASGLAAFDAEEAARESEEQRVHRVTRQVLSCVDDEPLRRVIEAYRSAPATFGPRGGRSPKYA